MPQPTTADVESVILILGFLGTVVAAWMRATKWCLRFVMLHEEINEEVTKIRTDLGILVDQMHELGSMVRQNERDTERLSGRFDMMNGKYTKN